MRVPPFVPSPIGCAGEILEYDTKEHACMLAQRIRDVWKRYGHHVDCIAQPVRDSDGRISAYSLKSSLLNGLPRQNV